MTTIKQKVQKVDMLLYYCIISFLSHSKRPIKWFQQPKLLTYASLLVFSTVLIISGCASTSDTIERNVKTKNTKQFVRVICEGTSGGGGSSGSSTCSTRADCCKNLNDTRLAGRLPAPCPSWCIEGKCKNPPNPIFCSVKIPCPDFGKCEAMRNNPTKPGDIEFLGKCTDDLLKLPGVECRCILP